MEESGVLRMVRQDDNQMQKLVEMSIEMGSTIIIDQVGNHVSHSLITLLHKKFVEQNGQTLISFNRKNYKYDANFNMYVVSNY